MSEDKKATIVLDKRELATVLAALRVFQSMLGISNPEGMPQFAEVEPLSWDEIDTLCERINLGG